MNDSEQNFPSLVENQTGNSSIATENVMNWDPDKPVVEAKGIQPKPKLHDLRDLTKPRKGCHFTCRICGKITIPQTNVAKCAFQDCPSNKVTAKPIKSYVKKVVPEKKALSESH